MYGCVSELLKIFSRTDCGYCDAVKYLLQTERRRLRSQGCDAPVPTIVDLDRELDPQSAKDVIEALATRTGAATVPRVFVDQKCIGGATDVAEYAKAGMLSMKLRAMGQCSGAR